MVLWFTMRLIKVSTLTYSLRMESLVRVVMLGSQL